MDVGHVSLLGVGLNTKPPGWHLRLHAHPCHELVVVCRGEQQTRIQGATLQAGPGAVLVYPRGISHEECSPGPGKGIESVYMSFDWDGMPEGIPPMLHDRLGRIRVLVGWLVSDADIHSDLAPQLQQTLFLAILGQVVRLWTCSDATFPERIRHYVRQHLAEPFTLEDLAGHVDMSKYHFAREYKRLAGRTPMHDARILRLEAARDRIMTSHDPLKVVAAETGLGNATHLSRLFRRYLGVAPGSLRIRR